MIQQGLFADNLPRTRNSVSIPGLEFHRQFLNAAEQLRLLREVEQFSWSLDYDRRVQFHRRPFPPFAMELIGRLLAANMLPSLPDHMSVIDYAPGVGIGHHVDRGETEQITIISLGHEYEMDFRHNLTASQHSMMLELGSVLILKGEARWEWQHGIRSRLSDYGVKRERRVSVTFRNVLSSL